AASDVYKRQTLFLAVALLPADFALLRIVGGIVLAVFGTWLVTLALRRRLPSVVVGEVGGRGLRWLESAMRAFSFEEHLRGHRIETPADLVAAWLSTAWRIARVAVPMLLVAAAVIGWVAPVVTALGGGNTLPTVLFATLVGVLFMIPTWTELAIAAPLIQQGLTGPAAALLLALPAVSLPSLVIYGAALRDWRVPALLVAVVAAASVVAGVLFL
ncbi:MAG: permease, partial [Thermomicrobium sp.]|nr:permease [Thermomicrobium sp.]